MGGHTTTDYDSVTNLGTVTATAPKPRTDSYNPNAVLFGQTYSPVEVPYDPTVPDLGTRVIAVKPDIPNEGLTEAQWRDWWAEEQVKVFSPFTGGLSSIYDGIKSWLTGDWWGVGLAAAGAIPIGKFGGLGYTSFRAFKRAEEAAGEGMQWHHIVEQNPINRKQFSPYQIHNVDNLVRVDKGMHAQISGHYSSNLPDGSMRVRDWLGTKSFDEQYEYGMQKLRDYGAMK